MGGADKCLLRVGQLSILERTVRTLSKQSENIYLNVNGDASRFAQSGLEIFADFDKSLGGPLYGISTALSYLRERHTDAAYILTVAGDCPFLPEDLLPRLLNAAQSGTYEVAIAQSLTRNHYVIGLWATSIKTKLDEFIANKQHSVGRFIRTLKNTQVAFEVDQIDPFFNINTADDYQQAQQLDKL
ncbi:MAG: hypothetical protein COA42_10630 [Alteromonadaceae bacterium]|nr:MAG: hypothetical protein COA42_10630 [Alteromonadaceae bacterium]